MRRTATNWLEKSHVSKHLSYLHSPEYRHHRAQEVQAAVAKMIAEAELRPRLDLPDTGDDWWLPYDKATVMTMAREIANKMLKDQLSALGIRYSEVTVGEIAHIARIVVNTDPSLIEAAKAKLQKMNWRTPKRRTSKNASTPKRKAESNRQEESSPSGKGWLLNKEGRVVPRWRLEEQATALAQDCQATEDREGQRPSPPHNTASFGPSTDQR
jgi:hypothetical protein